MHEDFAVGYLRLADVEQLDRARRGEDERLHRAGAVLAAGVPGAVAAGAMTAGTVPPSGCVSRGGDSPGDDRADRLPGVPFGVRSVAGQAVHPVRRDVRPISAPAPASQQGPSPSEARGPQAR
jgi:hypothetical protein